MKPGRSSAKRKVHINHTKAVEYCNPDSPLHICELKHVKSADNQADIFTKIGVTKGDWVTVRTYEVDEPTYLVRIHMN